MPLPNKFKRYTFAVGFGISLFPFVAMNLTMYIFAVNWCTCDTVTEAGFPLNWYACNWVFQGVIWDAFVFNVMLVLTASVISAKILKSILQPDDYA